MVETLPPAWLYGAIAVVVVAGLIVLARLRRDRPLHLGDKDVRVAPKHFGDFRNSNAKGDLGELLTGVMLAAEGWTSIPSHYEKQRGLDGLFVRKRANGGYEARIIETKVNTSRLGEDQLRHKTVLHHLQKLSAVGGLSDALVKGLVQGLERQSAFVVKELWTHKLDQLKTTVQRVNKNGEPVGEIVERRFAGQVMLALDTSLYQFDRCRVYLVGDDPDPSCSRILCDVSDRVAAVAAREAAPFDEPMRFAALADSWGEGLPASPGERPSPILPEAAARELAFSS